MAAADAHLRHRLVLQCALKSPMTAPLVLRGPPMMSCAARVSAVTPMPRTGCSFFKAGAEPACSAVPQCSGPSQAVSTWTFVAPSRGCEEASGCCTGPSALHHGGVSLPRSTQAAIAATSLDCTLLRTETDASSFDEGPQQGGIIWLDPAHRNEGPQQGGIIWLDPAHRNEGPQLDGIVWLDAAHRAAPLWELEGHEVGAANPTPSPRIHHVTWRHHDGTR